MTAQRRGRPPKAEKSAEDLQAKLEAARNLCSDLEVALKNSRKDEAAALKRVNQLESQMPKNGGLTEKQAAFMCFAHMFFENG